MKNLLIAVVTAFLGYFLSGCEGMDNPSDLPDGGLTDARPSIAIDALKSDVTPTTGLKYTASGSVYCPIPSPTGDTVVSGSGYTGPASMLAMRRAIEGSIIAFIVVADSDRAEKLCLQTAGMTSAQCKDVAHDYVDNLGMKHCYLLQGMAGTPNCKPSIDGSSTCALSAFSGLNEANKFTALCSPSGGFIGWRC